MRSQTHERVPSGDEKAENGSPIQGTELVVQEGRRERFRTKVKSVIKTSEKIVTSTETLIDFLRMLFSSL